MSRTNFRQNLSTMAAAIPIVAALLIPTINSSQAFGQAQAAPVAPPTTAEQKTAAAFEIADIHASPNVRRFPFMNGGNLSGDRYILRQATMTQIIAAAYNLDPANVHGGPTWLDWDHFDIEAKAPPATPKATIRIMLQSLLAQRFSLVVHTGTSPLPAYVLSAPGGKSKLKESVGAGDPDCQFRLPADDHATGQITQVEYACHNETMEKFAEDVHNWTGTDLTKPVVDSTGLKGTYDFNFKFTSHALTDHADPDTITVFDAVDKELGLKLALETAPLPVLTVDSVKETPTPNPPDLAMRMPQPPPQFEVATIKPAAPDKSELFLMHGNQFNGQAISLRHLIQFAWDLNFNDDESLGDAPNWMGDNRFDIVAKVASDDSPGATPKAPQILVEDVRQMMRGLVEDRFRLKDHWENRSVTAYNLVAANPKLAAADPRSRTRCDEGPGPDGKDPRLANPVLNRLLTCQNLTMAQLGTLLPSLASGFIFSPVLDDTGLKGSYNFTLSFSSADHFAPGSGGGAPSADGTPQPADPNGAISLFDAVKNQLGLKLEKAKRPAPVLVIDHIEEQPTAN